MIKLTTPLTKEKIAALQIGDAVELSGIVYTARDAAHKKIVDRFHETGETLLKGEVIYYAGPCPAKPNEPIGSVGPTTSYRMDAYTPTLNGYGAIASIGKGNRSDEVKASIHAACGVHFDAVGGAGAYYKHCVKKAEPVYFPELGAEAVYKLTVEDFPLIVSII